VESTLGILTPKELESNSTFKSIKELIPGDSTAGQLDFIGQSFDSTKGWMSGFVNDRGLTQQGLFSKIQGFIDFSADKLVYVGAFLDMTTNYYEHTGIQTLARRLIERAVAEI
jgi:hypothetical protein